MSSRVAIRHIVGKAPLIFSGDHDGAPITIRLDSSASLKIKGDLIFDGPSAIPPRQVAAIERAAERLIAGRYIDSGQDLSVTVSAIDLD